MGSDKEMVMSGVVSRMRAGLVWGLAAGVVLLMAGDHAQTASPANTAIDPYEILDLQIRPNAIIVLDSSGSMREERRIGLRATPATIPCSAVRGQAAC